MKHDDTLPSDLLWQDDGHVTDVVVDAIADGEVKIVPLAMLNHVNRCDACATRVGQAALLSVDISDAMRRAANAPAASRAAVIASSWPIPVRAVAAAALLAVIGAVPALSDAPVQIAAFAARVIDLLPTLVHAMLALGRTGLEGLAPFVVAGVLSSVALLLLTGFAIARAAPRQLPAGGGLQ
jgi:hypothetical protein